MPRLRGHAFLLTLVALAWLGVLPARADQPGPAKKYNVLFLFSDDQRADTIAALGNKVIRTPNLDRLVHEGTSFLRAYCMGARQGAVCVPSRAMLMSGRTLFRVSEKLEGQTTWPEMFARAGYVTFITGKWHNGGPSVMRAFMKGSSIFLGGMGNPYQLPIADLTTDNKLTTARTTPKHSVEQFADSMIAFLRGHKGDRPFVGYVAFNAPHDPRLAPPSYHDYYNAHKPPVPPNFLPQHPFNNGDLTGRDERLAPWPRTPAIVRKHLADYYAAINFVDTQVGRILQALKDSGQYENTIIVFTSDHGLAIGSHGLFGKQNIYDHSMHVPLILAGPGIPKDRRNDAFVYLLDLFPTLGAMNGVPAPEGSEGKNLVPVLQGKARGVRESLFLAYRHLQRSVLDDRWQLIVYPQINKSQLFDLRADPHELKDLAADPSHAADVRRLTLLLQGWQKKLGDDQPLTSKNPQPVEFDFSKVPPPKKAEGPAPRPPVVARSASPALAKPARKKQPNIVYIMADDHASAAIGAYGSWLGKYARTPNLDRLAKQGMRFTNGMVTNSICTPSRAAILTGQYSHKNGVYTLADAIDPTRIHIGHLLQRLGYRTAMIGKWHLHTDPAGFDYWNILPGQGVYHNPKLRRKGDKKPREYTGGYSEDVITDLSLEWLKQRDKETPFFLCCHFKAPHRPWDPAQRFVDQFKDDTIPEPPTLLDHYEGRAKAVAAVKMVIGENMNDRDLQTKIPRDLPRDELRKWAYQRYMKRYLACVAAVDENVGRILDFLDREGLTEDTIVIYTSDQGFFLGEHGFFDKRLMYEPCLTTPLIVRWPGHTRPGSINEDIVLNIDHAPLFLDINGAAVPGDMQGRSYKSILEGKTPPDWRRSMYYRYWMHLDGSHNVPACYGVRTTRYTLIYYYGKGMNMKGAQNIDRPPEWELFDLQKDGQEMRNVYNDPAYAPVVRDLRVELERLRHELGDER